jgi:hypothetical protein
MDLKYILHELWDNNGYAERFARIDDQAWGTYRLDQSELEDICMCCGVLTPLIGIDTLFNTLPETFFVVLRSTRIVKKVESIAQADIVGMRAADLNDSRNNTTRLHVVGRYRHCIRGCGHVQCI